MSRAGAPAKRAKQRTRLTRAEAKARTRELVLVAAGDVFRRLGYHASSVEEVAEQAGFSRGAVYSNFASKDELFLAVYDREVERRTARLLEVMAEGEKGADVSVDAAAETYGAILQQDPEWSALVVEFAAHASRNPTLRSELKSRSEANRDRIASGIAATIERFGMDVPIDVRHVAFAAQTINSGAAVERLVHDDVDSTPIYRLVSVLFVRALGELSPDDPLIAGLRMEEAE